MATNFSKFVPEAETSRKLLINISGVNYINLNALKLVGVLCLPVVAYWYLYLYIALHLSMAGG